MCLYNLYVQTSYLLKWFNEIDYIPVGAVYYFEMASSGNVRKGKKVKWN